MTKLGAGILTMSGNDTFAAGLFVQAGTVSGMSNTTVFGAGSITLGVASGTANATILGDTRTFANPIILASSDSGILAIGNSGTANAVFSGGVTGSNNLVIKGNSTGTVTLSGATANNAGTITNLERGGSGTMLISSAIGSGGPRKRDSEQQFDFVAVKLSGATINTYTQGSDEHHRRRSAVECNEHE